MLIDMTIILSVLAALIWLLLHQSKSGKRHDRISHDLANSFHSGKRSEKRRSRWHP